MFKHRVKGASRDRVYRTSSACVACPDGSPLIFAKVQSPMEEHMVHIPPRPHQLVWLYTGGAPNQTIFPNCEWHEVGEGAIEKWRELVGWNKGKGITLRKS